MRKSEKITYIFILPTVIILLLMTVYPLIYALVKSFYKVDLIKDTTTFVGIKNYITILKDEIFWNALKNTVIFVLISVFIEFLLGLLFALFFNLKIKALKIFRSIVLVPMLLPPITVALTWKMMFEYNTGILNYMLETIGLNRIEWLSSAKYAMMSIIFTDIWQWTPFVFLVILASLQSIPESLYESAKVSGATPFQCFIYITLPLLKPGLILTLLLRTIDTFRIFDKMYTLTGGGPGKATDTITYYIYRQGFKYFQTGYASASAVIMVIFVFLFSSLYIKRVMKNANYN
ncbi:carbohydrate ABC transporter permease [Clostridium sp. ZS2-4]|uniref:carbohydrate ABC transporter permease n=1 Tax=Clostridium sp. ZS2-4 TaxID=2987703 RepID=UPI00227B7EF3|nr:sugar ABC transporter permease [Clostridium sp. ZS2-4]MCY6355910.1 sugar ABC transporter permease [Clostridium sp. ZS2-4]